MLPLSPSSKGQKTQWGKDREDELESFFPAPKKHKTDSYI